MHPAVTGFVEHFHREAKKRNSFRNRLGHLEIAFLDQVWGPAFEYNFTGLTPEYPLKDFRGGQRFIDFRYDDGFKKTMIELDGFATHAKQISSGKFDDHLERQNDLLLKGWFLLRFSANMVFHKPEICQRQLMHAMGRWHYVHGSGFTWRESEKWSARKSKVIRVALRSGGNVRPIEVAKACGVSNQTAALWLKRFAKEGLVTPSGSSSRISFYRLATDDITSV